MLGNKQDYPFSVAYNTNRAAIMMRFRQLFCALIRLSVRDVARAEKERFAGDLSSNLLRGKQLLRCAATAVRQ